MIEIKVPPVGESITEVTLVQWLKEDGAWVERDEVLCELESEKATFELNAEQAGILHHVAQVDEEIAVGAVACTIDETAAKPDTPAGEPVAVAPEVAAVTDSPKAENTVETPVAPPAPSGGGIIEIKVPPVGESITEVTLVQWLKEEGAWVERDEILCELESEKATFELNAEQAGVLHQMVKPEEELAIGAVACTIDTGAVRPAGSQPPKPAVASKPKSAETPAPESKPEPKPAAIPAANTNIKATPVAQAIMADKKVQVDTVKGTGSGGRILKNDVLAALENPGRIPGKPMFSREDKPKKMSNLRKTISRRLVEAKNSTAMLTTFNEADMSNIMAIRKANKDKFKETHGIGLGFMSFFTKACCIALQEWPAVNAHIDGDNLVYHEYCDISIAVSAPKGLVVPVIRNAESLSMAEIEKEVATLAKKARENKLSIEEMTGGTFTITNGGVFGSLMSTPILNLPQSAILGMHKIQERPVVINGKVEVRPMMYLAVSYDHRVIDGRESVGFLVRVKELLENPEQLLMGKDPVQTLLEL